MPQHKTVRRSVALPAELVQEVMDLAPAHLRGNLNRLVLVSLQEFAKRQRAERFDRAMAEMAADPAIRSECISLADDFAPTETDGLSS